MKILKFGGTSVGTPDRMRHIARLVQNSDKKIVVLSALSGTTNTLVEISRHLYQNNKQQATQLISTLKTIYIQFTKDLFSTEIGNQKATQILEEHFKTLEVFASDFETFTDKEEKIILAQGEMLSTRIFHTYLEEQKIPSVFLQALHFMRTGVEGEPDLTYIEDKLRKEIAEYPDSSLFITQGYICLNAEDNIDNLKRGGSDYSASLIGAALRAEEIQIWTDIDGMHNSDPRIVKNTKPVAELSFEEAAELAYFGAKILHPATIHPAQQYNIPVKLLNTMQPEALGTTIKDEINTQPVIKSIAAKDQITAIKIKSTRMLMAYGFLRKIFEIFESYKTPIDMITTSEVAVSLTIDNDTHLVQIITELEKFGTVEIDYNQTIVCVVGNFVAEQLGTAASVFTALQTIPVRMISFGGSRNNISILVNTSDKNEALIRLHQGLF
jgi:aspartate kinase